VGGSSPFLIRKILHILHFHSEFFRFLPQKKRVIANLAAKAAVAAMAKGIFMPNVANVVIVAVEKSPSLSPLYHLVAAGKMAAKVVKVRVSKQTSPLTPLQCFGEGNQMEWSQTIPYEDRPYPVPTNIIHYVHRQGVTFCQNICQLFRGVGVNRFERQKLLSGLGNG
jgi:hypothetical protein